jgi:HEAT repeat protein
VTDACTPIRELVSAQLDADLSPDEEQQLLDHLASCSGCQIYRRRLKTTVEAIRGADVALVEVPGSVFDGLEARLQTVDGSPADDGCFDYRELISADIDGDLSAEEQEELRLHLASCASCQLQRERLVRVVNEVRGANVTLVVAPEQVYEALDARLAGSGAETIPLAAAVTELALVPAAGGLASVSEDEAHGEEVGGGPATASGRTGAEGRAPRGRVIQWPQLVRWAAAAAVFAVAGALAYDRLPVIQSAMRRFLPETKTPEMRDNVPVLRNPERTPPPEDTVVPDTTVDVVPKPLGDDVLPPDPVDPPTPTPTDLDPDTAPDEPIDTPPADGPPKDPTQEHVTPERVEIQLAALRDTLRRIPTKGLEASERAGLITSLGQAQFDHPEAYACLSDVLAGRLDAFDDPGRLRTAAFGALGSLGTPAAVEALVEAPLRRPHIDRDGADLISALARLESADSVRALASVFERRKTPDPGRSLLIVEVLAGLRRPESVQGLLALYTDRGEPAALRGEAAIALGSVGDDRAFGPVRDGLGDRKLKVRAGSALALGALAAALPDDAVACVAALAKALNDRKVTVALAAIEGLGLSRRREAIEPLIACLDRRGSLKRSALRTLRMLAGPKHAKATAGLRSPERWRGFWGKRVAAVIPPAAFEDLDLKSFRRVVSDSSGVVFVIDTSGSMEPKWDAVCYELKKALEDCGPSTRFQVLFFSDAPRALWPNKRLAPATPEAKALALKAAKTQSVISSGKTAIGLALSQALDHTQAETIYLISDGLESRVTFSGLQRAVRRQNVKRARPAKIHTVHVRFGGRPLELRPFDPQPNEPDDVSFMRKLAWENGGVYAHN